jgi:two-component system OmpR family response regulator
MIESNLVLVIDDDPSVCEVVADTLESNGFQPIIANSAAEGMRVLGRGNIDLIIVDLGLPDMDGLELTRSVKSLSKAGVIILGGRTETTEKVVGLELGADDYLTKPFEPRELVARVRSVLRRSSSSSEITGEKGGIYEFDGWPPVINRRELTNPDNKVV